MKCLLLLLALELATSDKLDRTYLPPPGAKYSGGTLDDLHPPLAYTKESYTDSVNGPSKVATENKSGFPASQDKYPNFSSDQTTKTPFTTIKPVILPDTINSGSKLMPGSNVYNTFPSNFPSTNYLPSKQTFATQFSEGPNSELYTTSYPENVKSKLGPNKSNQYNKNYYYVPAKASTTKPLNYINNSPSNSMLQYPNQINENSYLDKNMPLDVYTRRPIVPNYQPNAFGYYGGNPMIMTVQNLLEKDKTQDGPFPNFVGIERENVPTITSNNSQDQSDIDSSPFKTDLKSREDMPKSVKQSFRRKPIPASSRRNGFRGRPRQKLERPQASADRNAVIKSYNNEITPEGYSYSYDTSNGIHAHESATTNNGTKAQGSYSYTGDDGKLYTVTYTADENGFRPQGDHLPTPPPIPDAIKKVIEQAEKNRVAGEFDDGSYDDKKYGYLNYESKVASYRAPIKMPRNPNRIREKGQKNNYSNGVIRNGISPNTRSGNNEVNIFPDTEGTMKNIPNENFTKSSIMYRPDNKQINTANLFQNNEDTNEKENYKPQSSTQNKGSDVHDSYAHKMPTSGSGVNPMDDGYYYVPPITEFNPNTAKLQTEKVSYLPNIHSPVTKTDSKTSIGKNGNPLPLPINRSSDATTTRKPYISGPTTQISSNKDLEYPNNEQGNTDILTYPDTFVPSGYLPNTTPITSQFEENQRIENDGQYYIPPSNNDPTELKTVETRFNAPLNQPGITVTQDFSTTLKPIFKDGVLEVKQKVNIFGLRNPEVPINNINTQGFDSNGFIPTPSGINEPLFLETPNIFNPALGQETNNIQGQDMTNGPVSHEPTFGAIEEYSIPNSDTNQGYSFEVPTIPFNSQNDGQSLTGPEQNENGPGVTTQNASPNVAIGEDFRGPKQTQQFDPATGYYY